MDKYVGKKLDGRYEIRELIGIGGMANVYRCYDTIDDREVAIKILKDEFLNNEEFIRRFKNESKAIAVLSHPNIVKVYDVSFGDMIQYIVMEYIDGITLKEYINQQNVLSWKETVHLVTQVLAALSHAHSKGVVHRDIKPQNMMLLSDGTIKVTDFGIARFSNSTRTMTEQAIGSVHYIAPEQAKGDITDGKTDIYSIGIMMYEMLTGKLPFDGENAVSVALMHLQVEPVAPRTINPSIPEGIEEIILKAIQKQPVDRYQSAQDMLADIERFRMNPSVRFEYKYLYDKQPTKYVDAVNKGKSHRAEEYAKVVKDQDDEKVRHSLTIPIVAGILIAICIALIVCIPVGIFKNQNAKEGAFGSSEYADVEIPDFTNKKLTDVYAECESMGYKFELVIDYEYHADREKNVVLRQYPEKAGDKKIKANDKIELVVNLEDKEATVPDVYGKTPKEAEKELENEGFREDKTIITVLVEGEAEGVVVRTYPEANSIAKVSTPVYLYVSGSDAEVLNSVDISYKDIIGKDEEDARKALEGKEFENVKTEDISGTGKPKGEVVFMNILSGTVKEDSVKEFEIILYLSDGTPEIAKEIVVPLPYYEQQIAPQVYAKGTILPFETTDNNEIKFVVKEPVGSEETVTVQVFFKVDDAVEHKLFREYTVNFKEDTIEFTEAEGWDNDSGNNDGNIDEGNTGTDEPTTDVQ